MIVLNVFTMVQNGGFYNMKYLISIVILLVSTILFAASKADIEKSKLISLGFSTEPVGTIKQSILTESQFQNANGSSWVKMKGQSISGSKLCTDYSICTLPAAEGKFLRDSTSDGNLRNVVNDTTAKNGLVLSGSVGADNISTNRPVNGTVSSNGVNANRDQNASLNDSGTATGIPRYTGVYSTVYSIAGSSHDHAWSGYITAANFEHTHSNSFSLSTGDSETAPDHIIVNTFVKIN